ncbi:MAG: sensor histidine kinase, partial [Gammaproteobacteria bacterium]
MVNTFSEFARTPEIKPQPVNINELITEVLDLYANLNREARIETHLATDIPVITADTGRLRQVLNNILKNAFDACDKCPAFNLEISTQRVTAANREFVEIRIKDSGTGITEDIIGQMFDPYVTTKTKGTGLGLAIVKKIVEEHKGLVWLENNESGTGACAIIRLPINPAEDNMHRMTAADQETI